MEHLQKVEQDLKDALKNAVTVLREARLELPGDPATQLEQIIAQVSRPCIVAVVGQVKAGKSSFINALLRDDLAKVGTEETTATINFFCYSPSQPPPERTVRCFYRDGTSAYVDRAFLDSLQGNDIDTLHRAARIERLEYYLHHPHLERVTLVDTPGTGAAVPEHQNVTAEFLRLHEQLRKQHDQQTRELGDTADAVIYLIGVAAGSADQRFLEEFHELTNGQSSAFNAVGVMSKIDLYPEAIKRRDELSAKIAGQLEGYLNTVVPVSASTRRALDSLLANNRDGLQRLIEALRSLAPGKFSNYFSNPRLYASRTGPDWPFPLEQRAALRGKLDWNVFATIARIAVEANLNIDETGKQLNAIAGFDRLREVLELHFFQRSRLLRYFSKIKQARKVLKDLCYLSDVEKGDTEGQKKLQRYVAFIQEACQRGGNGVTARELDELVRKNLTLQLQPLDSIVEELDRRLAVLSHNLGQYNDNFAALQKVLQAANAFSPAEKDELQVILGWYGLEQVHSLSLEYVKQRQREWRRISMRDGNPLRRDVASQATTRYGFIQEELSGIENFELDNSL